MNKYIKNLRGTLVSLESKSKSKRNNIKFLRGKRKSYLIENKNRRNNNKYS